MDEIALIVEEMRDYADTRLAPTTAVAGRMYEFIRRIAAALAAIPADGWRPIESAPKEVDVLVYRFGAAICETGR